jgi:hypothetical protein
VQVERCIHLGSQDAVDPLGGQRAEDAIVEHACRVDDSGQGMVVGDGREELFQSIAIRHIAGGQRDASARGCELALEHLGSLRCAPLT